MRPVFFYFLCLQKQAFDALENKKIPFNKRDIFELRRDRDSNPGRTYILNGFQDRRIQPLCHLSFIKELLTYINKTAAFPAKRDFV